MQTALNSPSTKPKTTVGKFNYAKNLAKNTKPKQNKITKMQPLPYQMFANNSSPKNQTQKQDSTNPTNEYDNYNEYDNDDEENYEPQTIQGQINQSKNINKQQSTENYNSNQQQENQDTQNTQSEQKDNTNTQNNENSNQTDEEDEIDKKNKEVDEYNEQHPNDFKKLRYQKNLKQSKKDNDTIKEHHKQMMSRNFLRQAWLNVVPTFGVSLLYVWLHFIMRYVVGSTTYFSKFGALSPIPPQISSSKFYKDNTSTSKKMQDKLQESFGAEYFEIISAIIFFILVLFIIFFILSFIALVTGVLANPWKSTWEGLKALVRAYLPK